MFLLFIIRKSKIMLKTNITKICGLDQNRTGNLYWLYNSQNKTIYKYITGYNFFFKCIAGCTTHNVKIQNSFKMYCGLYNPAM